MRTLIAVLVCCSTVCAQDVRLLRFRTDTSVVLRWIGNTDESIEGWHVDRSVDGNVWERITAVPLVRELSQARATERVGAYKAGFYLTLFGADTERDLTRDDVRKVLRSSNNQMFFVMLASQPDISVLTGERYEDRTLPAGGRRARYRIAGMINGVESRFYETDDIDLARQDVVPRPGDVVVDGRNNAVLLKWPRDARASSRGDVVAFRVWRSQNEDGPFEEITAMNAMSMFTSAEDEKWYSWTDDLVDNGNIVYYYIRNVHGTGVVGERSDIIRAVVGADASPSAPLSITAHVLGNAIEIAWKLAADSIPVTSFELHRRSENDKKLVKHELSLSDTSYLDALVEVGVAYQYHLTLTNAKHVVSSDTIVMFIPDNVAPLPPTMVKVTADTGRIKVFWNRSTDRDVIGYHVFRSSDSRRTSRLQLTSKPIRDTFYVDTLHRNAEGFHGYYVVAEDHAGNSSKPSMTVVAKTIDVTPPPTPQIIRFEFKDSTLHMEWTPSRAPDVWRYVVESRDSTTPWKTVYTTSQLRATLNVTGYGKLLYRVIAEDSAQNKSAPSIERVVIREKSLLAPSKLTAKKGETEIQLQWSTVAGAVGYRISRIDPRSKKQITCANVSAKEQKWSDKYSQRDLKWIYRVEARNERWVFGPAAEHTYEPPKE